MHNHITENLFKKLADDCEKTVILTPNLRLSRFLHQQFDKHQQTTQKAFWLTPIIMPLNSWLSSWWNQQEHNFFLLNNNQEYTLWSEIIRRSLNAQFSPEIVGLAKEAWGLLNRWELPLESLENNPIDDIALFHSWATEFNKILCAKNYCVTNNIITLFFNLNFTHNNHKLINLPHKIILMGFEDLALSPQEKNFFTTLNDKLNCKVERFNPNTKSSTQRQTSFLDQKQEILHMALWAHKLWQENPNQAIACIAPNLTSIKSQVERTFKEVFSQTQSALPFNISIGESLSHYPIVNASLQIISLFLNLNDAKIFAQLLTSPFIDGATTELGARAILKNKIKNYYKYHFDLTHFLDIAKKTCPIFSRELRNYLDHLETIPKSNSPSGWIKIFVTQLQTLGWLKNNSLNSAEYQTLQRWQQTLKEFSSLDLVLPKLSHQNAVQYLNSFTKKIIFQPKTPPTSINILGTLEAAGLNFDQMWVMSMNEHIFPSPAKPNPFLPITLQKKLNLPNSSLERELHFCHNLIERLAHSADKIIYSYAQKEEEQDLRISPLIAQIPVINGAELNLAKHQTIAQRIQATSKLEQLIDNTAPPLLSDEKITGGSKLIEQQSLCPFMAFAAHRLHAKSASNNSLKTIRGTLIHETLKQIWSLVKNKNNLQRLSSQELQNIITQYLTQSIVELKENQKMLLHDSHLALEQQCLTNLLSNWLLKEQDNYGGLFFEITATEKEIEFSIEQITLKLRIDRIDKIESLGLVIVDYKTGKPKPQSLTNQWTDERPTNIQLPLYCLALEENLVGLIFAQIHVTSMCDKKYLHGWITDEKLKNDEKNTRLNVKSIEEWQKIKAEWHTKLTNLAKEFCQGHALVSPKNPKETCEYCEFKILCRKSDY